VFAKLLNGFQSVNKACNGTYWNATDKVCLAQLSDVYAVCTISSVNYFLNTLSTGIMVVYFNPYLPKWPKVTASISVGVEINHLRNFNEGNRMFK